MWSLQRVNSWIFYFFHLVFYYADNYFCILYIEALNDIEAFLGSEMNLHSQAIGWLTHWLTWPHNKLNNLSIISWKYVNIVILIRVSPRLLNIYWKFSPTLLHWATDVFSNGLRKYAIWFYVEKYLNIATLYRIIIPQLMKCYRKFNQTLFH